VKRTFPFSLLFLLLFGLVIVPEPVLTEHEQDLEKAATFLQNQYNQTLQLCAESPTPPWNNNYWLWTDNYLAYEALKFYNETMANEIYSKLQEYGYMKNYAYEALFKQSINLPFQYSHTYILKNDSGYTIAVDLFNVGTFSDWDHYCNLLILAALSEYWRCWYDPQVLYYFNKAAAMWDGTGIIDEVNNEPEDFFYGLYETFKLALLLYAERILGQSLSYHNTAESIIWQLQNASNYGIHNLYNGSIDPLTSGANVETTSLVIGAYKYSFSRSCPTPSVSPTRRACQELAQSLAVLAMAMYLGTFLLKNRRRYRR